jgi:hypothetical protein
MTQLHSITFEKIKIQESRIEGTKEYHILYLLHSKISPGMFDIKNHNPFLKEKTTGITFDIPTRIVGYSTDVPIIIMCDGQRSIILMPNHSGQLVFLPPHGYPPDSKPTGVEQHQEIIGILQNRYMQFQMFPKALK